MRLPWILCLAGGLLLSGGVFVDSVEATQPSRTEIRSTPMLERPYRFGHVYGNSVRRRHHRGAIAAPPVRVPRATRAPRAWRR